MADDTPTKLIERDPTFSRHYADLAFAYPVRGGMELVFVTIGPDLLEGPDDENANNHAVYAEENRFEVARIRMRPSAAVAMAIDALREAINSPGLKLGKIKDDVQSIVDQMAEKVSKVTPPDESRV